MTSCSGRTTRWTRLSDLWRLPRFFRFSGRRRRVTGRRRISPNSTGSKSILIQAGLRVTTARGLSDEGDPWFVFCRAEDDEVIIHFARIDGNYVISAPAYCGNAAGRDFRSLVRSLIEQHPMLQLRPRPDNLYLHPAALLVVLVATALVKLSPSAAAATPAAPDGADADRRAVPGQQRIAGLAEGRPGAAVRGRSGDIDPGGDQRGACLDGCGRAGHPRRTGGNPCVRTLRAAARDGCRTSRRWTYSPAWAPPAPAA